MNATGETGAPPPGTVLVLDEDAPQPWTELEAVTSRLDRWSRTLLAVAVVALVFAAGLLVGMELHDSKIVLVDDPVVSTPPTTPPVPFRP